ncbi:MAG: hypothetical protein ABI479_05885 [Gallionella sp.]
MANMTLEGYLAELKDIKQKLSDFLDMVDKGNLSYFKDISLKLRVLYCDKSGTDALLKVISGLFNFDIVVFVSNTIKEKVKMWRLPASLMDGLVFNQRNSVVRWFERGDEEISIFRALERKEVLYGNEQHSYKEIIEVAADRMTAHIDKTIKDKDAVLHDENFLIGGLTVAQRAIIDTARSTIILLDMILSFVEDGKQYRHLRPRKM